MSNANPVEMTDEDMGLTDEQMGVQGLENFAPIGEKAISGATVGADPYQFQKPTLEDDLAKYSRDTLSEIGNEKTGGIARGKAAAYNLPIVGPLIPKALDAVGLGENNVAEYSQASEDNPVISIGSSMLSPSPVGKLGIIPRIAGAGADAAMRADDQGESPTAWGLAGAAMQGGGELMAKIAGKLATAAAPHIDNIADNVLSKFLGLVPEDIARLKNSGELKPLLDSLRMEGNTVLKSGVDRQGAFNAATSLTDDAIAAKQSIPMTGTMEDVLAADKAIANSTAVKSGLRRMMSPGSEGSTPGMRQGIGGLISSGVEAMGGQRVLSTAGLGAKDIAQKILSNPVAMSNPNASGVLSGRIMRFLQIVNESDNPDVDMEIGMQDPEINAYMNSIRKQDNK